MAAPKEITLRNFNETIWVFNSELSSDYDSVLQLQGVSMLMRMVMVRTSLTVTTKQWEDAGETHLELQNTVSSALPSTTEKFVLNWEANELYDRFFGNCRDRTRWIAAKELEEQYLKEGWEEGTSEVIQVFTDHLDVDVTTDQTWGFEIVEGIRRHTRRLVVRKGGESRELRMVFDYVGLVSDKKVAA